MKNYFRALLTALQDGVRALQEIYTQLAYLTEALEAPAGDTSGVEARLDDLERSRALWEAEIDAVLTKAESKFRAARASEERTRRLAESADFDEEGLDDLPHDIQKLYRRDAEGGEAEGVQPMPESVEPRPSPQEVAAQLKGY